MIQVWGSFVQLLARIRNFDDFRVVCSENHCYMLNMCVEVYAQPGRTPFPLNVSKYVIDLRKEVTDHKLFHLFSSYSLRFIVHSDKHGATQIIRTNRNTDVETIGPSELLLYLK